MKKLPKANPLFGAPFNCGASRRRVRWCEAPESLFRFVGTSHDIMRDAGRRLNHTGWYLYPDGDPDETAFGVVFRLASGRGFIAGLRTSYDDKSACLAVCEAPEESAEDAARYADQLAERYAEAERDYQEAYLAGSRAADADHKAKDIRSDILLACRDLRAARRAMTEAGVQDAAGAIARLCDAARGRVSSMLAELESLRTKRDKLRHEWSGSEAFKTGFSDFA